MSVFRNVQNLDSSFSCDIYHCAENIFFETAERSYEIKRRRISFRAEGVCSSKCKHLKSCSGIPHVSVFKLAS